MFTGIVSAVGRVVEVRPGHLAVAHPGTAERVRIGSSVAVNGVCLTVTDREGPSFFADVVPETLRRSNLGALQAGDPVNLELPLTAEQGLDGHIVQGHVDGTALVEAVTEAELGREIEIRLPAELAPYVVEKGSVAVDGTSLTVAATDDVRAIFTVALIPHTLQHTIAGIYGPGTLVNVEVDVLARYVERLLDRGAWRSRG
jgi:riboflavin synthase